MSCRGADERYSTQLYFQNYMHYTAMQTVVRLLPMFVSGLVCNAIVGFMAAYIPIVWLLGAFLFHSITKQKLHIDSTFPV
jgi:hypothetical protein